MDDILNLLQRAYEDGWCAAAHWAHREDLNADIGSPAYIKDRDEALAAYGVAIPQTPADDRHEDDTENWW